MLIIIMLNVIMMNVIMLSVTLGALYGDNYYAECHYAECRYAECHGALFLSSSLWQTGPCKVIYRISSTFQLGKNLSLEGEA
jgi:hypothetical protein